MRIAGWLVVVVAALGALATGCHPQPPRLARVHPVAATVTADGVARWVDPAAGVVELHVSCRATTVEVWCQDRGVARCESKRLVGEPVACPAELTLTTEWGAAARATVSPDGVATFTLDMQGAPAEPITAPGPRDGWTLAHGGAAVAWHDATDLKGNALRRPPPPPPTPQRRYHLAMILTDVAVVITTPIVFNLVWDGRLEGGLALHGLLYLAAGPVVHHLHGNPRSGRSFLRRTLYPVAGIAGGVLLGLAAEGDCDEEENDECGLAPGLFGVLGGLIGFGAAMVHDWFVAHVDAPRPSSITPVISSDGEHTSIGVAGRF